jgi:hypothetical protein
MVLGGVKMMGIRSREMREIQQGQREHRKKKEGDEGLF